MEHSSLKQLSLYPTAQHFEVRAIDLMEGRPPKVLREISFLEYFQKYLKYLKYLNREGYNVYFFPHCPSGGGAYSDFLLDDVKADTLESLRNDGLDPLYYLETSPHNFQTILRFSENITDKAHYLEINRFLVNKYGADKGSVGTEHFFRLSGFTNRKEKYLQSDGQYPYVRLTVLGKTIGADKLPRSLGSSGLAPGKRGQDLPAPSARVESTHRPPFPESGEKKGKYKGLPNCNKYVAAIYRNSKITDLSRLDFKVAIYALKKGFPEDEIIEAMLIGSPDIESRKNNHMDDYLTRTIFKAKEVL